MKNKIQALIKFLNLYAPDDSSAEQCISDLKDSIERNDESEMEFFYNNILAEFHSDYLDLFLTTYADETDSDDDDERNDFRSSHINTNIWE